MVGVDLSTHGPGADVMSNPRMRAAEKVVTLDVLLTAICSRRLAGQRVAFTNGTFDLIHLGHLRSLEQARAQADLLVVGVNSDASVRGYKAPGRPIVSQADRAELVAGFACVNYVVIFDEPTADRLLAVIRPEVYVKGADYADKPLPERALVEAYGGRVVLVELEAGRSTSGLIERIVERFGPDGDGEERRQE
jgi:D-beta-D-heptose 7-phosphate kinase/D-beta-D-heptose 1-phosphate adenosyltransferase